MKVILNSFYLSVVFFLHISPTDCQTKLQDCKFLYCSENLCYPNGNYTSCNNVEQCIEYCAAAQASYAAVFLDVGKWRSF